MTDTEFVIVRHGETEANITGLFQGSMDCPLNDTGRKQAQAAAEYLRHDHFDAAFSSDLSRAMETALAIAARHPGLQVTPAPALREWNMGVMEGRKQKELLIEFPEQMRAFRSEAGNIAIPGGESRLEFQRRVEDFIIPLARGSAGKRILLVAHGGTLQRLFRLVVGETAPENILPLPANASVSEIKYYQTARSWQLVAWNSRDHLNGIRLHPTLAY